jgi:hypothetical protein
VPRVPGRARRRWPASPRVGFRPRTRSERRVHPQNAGYDLTVHCKSAVSWEFSKILGLENQTRGRPCFGAQSPWASLATVDGQSAGRFQAPNAFRKTGAPPARPVRQNGALQIRGFLGIFKNPGAGNSHPRPTVFCCPESLGEPGDSGRPVCGSVSGPECVQNDRCTPGNPVRPNGVLQIRGFLGIFKNPGAGNSHPRQTVFRCLESLGEPGDGGWPVCGSVSGPGCVHNDRCTPRALQVRPNDVLQIRGFLGIFKNPGAGKSHPRQTVFRCLESLGEPNGSGGPVRGSVSGPGCVQNDGCTPRTPGTT